jgi:hypothetical protein
MRVRVECYAGRKAYERPLRFGFDDHLRVVEEVLDSWYGPSDAFFKVRADDALSTSCGMTPPLRTGSGLWSRSIIPRLVEAR